MQDAGSKICSGRSPFDIVDRNKANFLAAVKNLFWVDSAARRRKRACSALLRTQLQIDEQGREPAQLVEGGLGGRHTGHLDRNGGTAVLVGLPPFM